MRPIDYNLLQKIIVTILTFDYLPLSRLNQLTITILARMSMSKALSFVIIFQLYENAIVIVK